MDSENPSQGNLGASNEVAPETLPGQTMSGMSQMSAKPTTGKLYGMGDETAEEYDRLRLIFIILLALAGCSGILALLLLICHHNVDAVAAKTALFSWNKSSTLHQVLMMFFGVILQGIAISVFRIFPFTFNRNIVKYIHFGLNSLVAIVMVVAVLSMYSVKEFYSGMYPYPPPKHFFTQHGWAGIITVPCFLGQLIGGTLFFLLPIVPMQIRIILMPFHKAGGWFLYLASCITASMALNNGKLGGRNDLDKDKPYLTNGELLVRFSFLFLFFHVIIMLYLTIAPQFKRRPRPA